MALWQLPVGWLRLDWPNGPAPRRLLCVFCLLLCLLAAAGCHTRELCRGRISRTTSCADIGIGTHTHCTFMGEMGGNERQKQTMMMARMGEDDAGSALSSGFPRGDSYKNWPKWAKSPFALFLILLLISNSKQSAAPPFL